MTITSDDDSFQSACSGSFGDIPIDIDVDRNNLTDNGNYYGNGHYESDPENELTLQFSPSAGCIINSSAIQLLIKPSVDSIDRVWSNERDVTEELSTFNHLAKSGGSKYCPFSLLAAKLFDDKLPLTKKVTFRFFLNTANLLLCLGV
ncbi:hypothetical protein KSS87_012447 [Heliosperma pusillum]|nr:hypothetical protein KSS87_012447 [Heliosperma pusillum]